MTSQIIPVDPFDFVVFGATGDLTERKLLPALYHRQISGQFAEPSRIIGASRSAMSTEEYRAFAQKALNEHLRDNERDEAEIARFVERLTYVSVDAKSGSGWEDLKEALGPGNGCVRVFYFAVGPSLFGDIATQIRDFGLITKESRVVVEKPIGRDLASAKALNDTIGAVFDETQVFRIDHYLGKETVQNLMALRFGNALYEPLWNSAHIDHVQITVAESVGLESRVSYYDKAGALRDMVQNHILQLLCLVAMEAPNAMDADAVRDEKLKVLRALRPITNGNAVKNTVRGQYRAGASSGGAVSGYLEELGAPNSSTETFVAIKAELENWRWAGVPFYLRTGKRLAERVSEIVIQFKPVPHSIFPENAGALLWLELDGDAAGLDAAIKRAAALCRDAGALAVEVAGDSDTRERLWDVRRALSHTLRARWPKKISEDVAVPIGRLPELAAAARAIGERHRLDTASFGHAGDGNLHVNFLYDPASASDVEARVKRAVADLFRATIDLGGTLSGEHGIGLSKRPYMPLEQPPALQGLQLALKRAWDPAGILNPGKVFF